MNEDELQLGIIEAATYRGWRWHHVRRSDKAIQMGDPGFPDLVMTRRGRLIIAELKGHGTPWQPGQKEWLADFALVPSVEARIIRPEDYDEALRILE